MMKNEKLKKVAILFDKMSVGGIPKASIPFMEELSKYCDVTLILSDLTGELQEQIPNGIRVLCYPNTSRVKKNLITFIKYIWYAKIAKRFVKAYMLIGPMQPKLTDEHFDCAIAYHGMNIATLSRVLYQINADKKAAWIHGDHPFEGKHKKDAARLYNKFDMFFQDSAICEKNFILDFPFVKNKSAVSSPLIDIAYIKAKAEEMPDIEYNNESLKILTVGRLSPEKGQDMVPAVILRLRKAGLKFNWYLVGDGPDRERIECLKKENNCDELHFLGLKTNPYPYIKNCDLYVQPSYSEAYSITAFEAATLGKVSVLTDVAGATEVLEDGVNTTVVEPNVDSIADGILKTVSDMKKLDKMSENLRKEDFSNKSEVEKFMAFLEG